MSVYRFMSAKVTAGIRLVIGPQQCGFVGLLGCPGIHYVIAEVEVLRYVYLQVLDEVLL